MEFHIIVVQTFDIPVFLSAMAATTVTKSSQVISFKSVFSLSNPKLAVSPGRPGRHTSCVATTFPSMMPSASRNTSSCFFFLIDMFLSIMKSYISFECYNG